MMINWIMEYTEYVNVSLSIRMKKLNGLDRKY